MSKKEASEKFPLKQIKKLSQPFIWQNDGAEYAMPEAAWDQGKWMNLAPNRWFLILSVPLSDLG